jgi:hypothetical protein
MIDDVYVAITKFLNEVIGTIWLLVLAAWGGSVKYFTDSNREKFNFGEYLIHISASAFAGLITAYACAANDVSYSYTAALAGIAGHMGVSAIKLLERRLMCKGDKNVE